MTIDDFITYTKTFNRNHDIHYHLNLSQDPETKLQVYQILNDQNQIVATIANQTQNNYLIQGPLHPEYLIHGIAHFANTPVTARNADVKVRLFLSQYDIEQLASIHSFNSSAKTLTLTNAQLHALRHFRRQFYQPDKI